MAIDWKNQLWYISNIFAFGPTFKLILCTKLNLIQILLVLSSFMLNSEFIIAGIITQQVLHNELKEVRMPVQAGTSCAEACLNL